MLASKRLVLVFPIVLCALLVACSQNSSNAPEDTATMTEGQTEAAQPAGTASTGFSQRPSPATPKPQPVVLPEGKTIVVRLDQSLGSKISRPGDTFSATVAEPVMAGNKVVIPKGASASGIVTDAKAQGRLAGEAILRVKLNTISVGDRSYDLETVTVSRIAKGKGKRTAVTVGGGAGLGALIGGIAGGGKGAAIGAAAGAGAGTAGAALTGNNDIVLPAESAISFQLAQPLRL